MFKRNKYTNWYFSIIGRAKERGNTTQYTENHHIIPKSLSGNNNKENIVALTAREHFICHLLLSKMCEEKAARKKMAYALHRMTYSKCEGHKRYTPNSRIFELARKIISDHLKNRIGDQNPMWGKSRSEETKRKISEGNKNKQMSKETCIKISNSKKGSTLTQAHKDAIGKSSRLRAALNPVKYTDTAIENFRLGQIKRNKNPNDKLQRALSIRKAVETKRLKYPSPLIRLAGDGIVKIFSNHLEVSEYSGLKPRNIYHLLAKYDGAPITRGFFKGKILQYVPTVTV